MHSHLQPGPNGNNFFSMGDTFSLVRITPSLHLLLLQWWFSWPDAPVEVSLDNMTPGYFASADSRHAFCSA